MKLIEGGLYLGIQPANQLILNNTDKYEFDEKRIEFRVLNKPKSVIAQENNFVEEIQSDSWYFIKELKTGIKRWLYSNAYQISAL
jgi:hypothetical protein